MNSYSADFFGSGWEPKSEPSGRKCGQLLVWDATCPLLHHLTPQLLQSKLEQLFNRLIKRRCKNINTLTHATFFTPVAIVTTGVLGPCTPEFLKGLGHRLRQVSGEANSYAYLTQRLSIAAQRGNAASVLGTMKVDIEVEEFSVYKLCCIVLL